MTTTAQEAQEYQPPAKVAKLELSREDWLEVRRTGIGSSDAAAVLGRNPFKSPYQTWLEKTGQVPDEDLSGNEAVQLGNALEDWVAGEFARRTGRKVRRDNFVRRSADYPWMLANLDRHIVAEDGGEPEILECKIAGARAFFGEEWGEGPDEIPERYLLQVQHQMVVAQRKRAFVAVLLASTTFRIYEINLDVELAEIMIDAERAFWDACVAGTLPPISSIEDAQRAFPLSKLGVSVEATADIAEAVAALRLAKQDEKSNKALIKGLQGKIGAFMGEADTLKRGAAGTLLTWKTQTRKAYTVKESSSRVMRLVGEEE